MLSLNRIEETVEKLLLKSFGKQISFPLSSLADAAVKTLNTSGTADEHRVRRETELLLLSHDDFFLSGETVYPLDAFFRGTLFRTVPSDAEVELGILFPGAAFIPFCSGELFPDEFQLTDSPGKKPFPVVSRVLPFACAASAFTMLGRSGIIDHLSAESESNRRALREAASLEQAEVELSAFDLSRFYRENQFQKGDALVIRVDDWKNACFSLRIQRAGDAPDEARKNAFVRDLEQALLRVCELEQDYAGISRQIAEAYIIAYENGHDLRGRPELSPEEYRIRMCEIAIRRDSSEWLLVPAGTLGTPGNTAFRNPEGEKEKIIPGITPDQFSASRGTLESMDAILAEINAPVSSIEIDAIILDAIANGEELFDSFRARISDILNPQFADDAQEAAFTNFLEDSWELGHEFFNPAADAGRAPLRARLLDLTQQRIDLSIRLLEQQKNNTMPAETAKTLRNLHRDILDTLALLNNDSAIDSDGQLEQLELRVGDIEDAWDDFLDTFPADFFPAL